MKNKASIFLLLLFALSTFAQTVEIKSLTGSFNLPMGKGTGVTLYVSTPGTQTAWQWYRRAGYSNVLVSTEPQLTFFSTTQCYVRVTYVVGGVSTTVSTPSVTINSTYQVPRTSVVSTTMVHEGIKSEVDLENEYPTRHGLETITYLDGYGRSAQTISLDASPSSKDIIQPYVYNKYGYDSLSLLPYTNGVHGTYHANATSEQLSFYATSNQSYASSTQPYAVSIREKSPWGTLLQQGGIGEEYQPNESTPADAKTVKYLYRTNTANEVRLWKYNIYSTQAVGTTFVPVNTLRMERTFDQHKQVTCVYTDDMGRVIYKKYMPTATSYAPHIRETYYVYDDNGKLIYEIPHVGVMGVSASYSFDSSSAVCKQTMHFYQYDKLDRVWYHRAPGAAPVYTVYDRMNRPILTQNGEQRKLRQWSYVKYDKQGRVVFTGLYTDHVNLTPAQMQVAVNAETVCWEQRKGNTAHGYTENHAFPRTNANATAQVLAINYYDDYDFNFDFSQDVPFKSETELPTVKADVNVHGKPTASKTKVMGIADEKWLWAVTFYDEMGRAIQTRSNSHVQVYSAASSLDFLLTNRTTLQVDFLGKVLKSLERQSIGTEMVVRKRYEYDHAGRLLREYHKLNTSPEVLLKENKYNELGQLIEKNLHKAGNQTTFLQSVDYTYNIRGRLTYINNPELNSGVTNCNNNDLNDLFGLQLFYENLDPGFSTMANGTAGKHTPRYDGKITGVKWRTKNNDFTSSDNNDQFYSIYYDSYSRMTQAMRFTKSPSSTAYGLTASSREIIQYDAYDNISTILRSNKSNMSVDNLQMGYDYYKLSSLYKNGATTVVYSYNANGNISYDADKRLNYEYNHMDLMSKVTWKSGTGAVLGTMQFVYDARGTMLQKVIVPAAGTGGTATVTDYIGSFCYENNSFKFVNTSEGRVVPKYGTYVYEYEIKDHQGYTRVCFEDGNNDGIPTVVQENHFYPSGVPWETTWILSDLYRNAFALQGKEYLHQGFGGIPLNLYDFGARMYDAQYMRWWAQDPMYQYDNPYAYCGYDPVNRFDPNGMWDWADLDPFNKNGGLRKGIDNFDSWLAKNEATFVTGAAVVGAVVGAVLCVVPGGAAVGAPLLGASASFLGGYTNARFNGAGHSESYEAGKMSTYIGVGANINIGYAPHAPPRTAPMRIYREKPENPYGLPDENAVACNGCPPNMGNTPPGHESNSSSIYNEGNLYFANVLKNHYANGGGEKYILTSERFNDIYSDAVRNNAIQWNKATLKDGIYKVPVNFYKSSKYDLAFGRATMFFNEKREAVGFYDYWDLDPKAWGVRSPANEGITRFFNYTLNGKNFDVIYGVWK